jgi:MFS family permease
VAVLISLMLLRSEQFFPLRRAPRAALWTQLADGLRYAASRYQLVFPLLLLAVVGTFGYNFGVTLPLLARYQLDVGSVGFGALNAAMGVGSVIGALSLAPRLTPSERVLLLAAGSFSVLLLLVAVVPWFVVALGVLVLLGFASIAYSACTNTTLQLNSKEEYRGRVLSLYTLLFAGTTPIGGAITGWLADRWGIDLALAAEAIVCLLAVGAGALWLWSEARSVRDLSPEAPPSR